MSQNLPGRFQSRHEINPNVDQDKDAAEYFKQVFIISIGINFKSK